MAEKSRETNQTVSIQLKYSSVEKSS